MGNYVTYGSEVQFYHFSSKMFLNGRSLCSLSDKSAYKLELSSIYSSGMIFRINSKYKLRQEGELIQYKDHILLFNMKMNCYLNFHVYPSNEPNYSFQKNKISFKPICKIPTLRTINEVSEKFEAYLTTLINGYYFKKTKE